MRDDAGRAPETTGESVETGAGDDRTGDHAGPGGGDEQSGNVAGEFSPAGPVEAGSPRLGNALFVIAGAYIAVLALTRLFVDLQGFDTTDLLVLTGGTVLVSLVFLGFFGLLTPDT